MPARVSRFAFVVLGLFTLLVGSACAGVPPELQGDWRASGAAGGDPNIAYLVELHLEGDTFQRTGYPPWKEQASITKIDVEGRSYTLHVTEWTRNGDHVEDGTITIVLAEDGGTITYEGHTLAKIVASP